MKKTLLLAKTKSRVFLILSIFAFFHFSFFSIHNIVLANEIEIGIGRNYLLNPDCVFDLWVYIENKTKSSISLFSFKNGNSVFKILVSPSGERFGPPWLIDGYTRRIHLNPGKVNGYILDMRRIKDLKSGTYFFLSGILGQDGTEVIFSSIYKLVIGKDKEIIDVSKTKPIDMSDTVRKSFIKSFREFNKTAKIPDSGWEIPLVSKFENK